MRSQLDTDPGEGASTDPEGGIPTGLVAVGPQQGRATTGHQRQEEVGVMLLEESFGPAQEGKGSL